MLQRFRSRFAVGFGSGLGIGLLMGVAMLVGAVVATRQTSRSDFPWNEVKLNATATHGGESFAMATGMVGDGMEGVFFLDFLTGDLQGYVLNSRTGKITAAYKRNIANDLKVEQGKKPAFLLATGGASFRVGGAAFGGKVPGQCVVYVIDTHSGIWGSYGVPFSEQAAKTVSAQADTFIPMAGGRARDIPAEP